MKFKIIAACLMLVTFLGLTATPYGELESSWQQSDATVTWTVRVPANSSATAWIPTKNAEAIQEGGKPLSVASGCKIRGQGTDGVKCQLGSGTYKFQFPHRSMSRRV